MADGIDWMDVQAMVEKAVQGEKWSRNRHVEDIASELRREFRREVIELREEMGELFVQMHATIKSVSDACDAGDNALQRVLDARTADGV
jgi:hypothetical protein